MTETTQGQVKPTSQKQALLWGLGAVVAQALYDLCTIHYVAIGADLFVGVFVGLTMYWIPAMTNKLSKMHGPVVSKVAPYAVVPIVVGIITCVALMAFIRFLVALIQH